MCDSLISYGYGVNATKIHKLNTNPTFQSSKTILGCTNYSLLNLGKNPRIKEHTFTNQRYKLNSYVFNFSCKMSVKEDNNELGLEFINDHEEYDAKKDVNLGFDEVLKAKSKDGFSNVEEEEDEDEEVKLKKNGKLRSKSRRNELIKRSSLLAKQVIGVQSAFNLGFVSQLWVDTVSWVVLEIEVKPSLLSSESGKVLLEDIERVGDVVLVQDEAFVLNEFRTVGLETLDIVS
ncbi:hypothetical protein RND81_01G022600 [Saponaria officinalis]|uniref:Uncharacterized protein n=1 Tax=Saponaria officinalis TaxID=3572 RepID=A0AAW1NBW8_SAPOF